MGNTLNIQKILEELDQKIEKKNPFYRVVFLSGFNLGCKLSLKTVQYERGCYYQDQITYLNNQIQKIDDKSFLLKTSIQTHNQISRIKKKIIICEGHEYFLYIYKRFINAVYEEKDFIPTEWLEDFFHKLYNYSEFSIEKAKKHLKIRNKRRWEKTSKDVDILLQKLDQKLKNKSPEYKTEFIYGFKQIFKTYRENRSDNGWYFHKMFVTKKISLLKIFLKNRGDTYDLKYIKILKKIQKKIIKNFPEDDFVSTKWLKNLFLKFINYSNFFLIQINAEIKNYNTFLTYDESKLIT